MNIYYKIYKLILCIKKIHNTSVSIPRKKAQMSMNVIVFILLDRIVNLKRDLQNINCIIYCKMLLGTQSSKANRWLRLL